MYSRCHVCRHALGTNSVVQHMRTGQRLAYDVDRGRLWVVCPGCGEWNLTPLEERWEALEECEALYRAPETRASSENIGISHAPGIDLIRIGSALRDELENWRYGSRFEARRREAKFMTPVAAVAAIGGTLAIARIAAGHGNLGMGLWSGAVLVMWGAFLLAPIGGRVGPRTDVGIIDSFGRPARILFRELKTASLRCDEQASLHLTIAPPTRDAVELHGNDALLGLGALLPRINWRGARPTAVREATELVAKAEQGARSEGIATPWSWIVKTYAPRFGRLTAMRLVPRLALEMAVSEELERQAMVGEAHVLGSRWLETETVAVIADDLLIPASIREWIEQHRLS